MQKSMGGRRSRGKALAALIDKKGESGRRALVLPVLYGSETKPDRKKTCTFGHL